MQGPVPGTRPGSQKCDMYHITHERWHENYSRYNHIYIYNTIHISVCILYYIYIYIYMLYNMCMHMSQDKVRGWLEGVYLLELESSWSDIVKSPGGQDYRDICATVSCAAKTGLGIYAVRRDHGLFGTACIKGYPTRSACLAIARYVWQTAARKTLPDHSHRSFVLLNCRESAG